MTMKITYIDPILPGSIVLWDAKYRKEGGKYPSSLSADKITQWKSQIYSSLAQNPTAPTAQTLAGPNRNHVNGSIGELRAYYALIDAGHFGVLKPGKVTEPGVDFITYLPLPEQLGVKDERTMMNLALSAVAAEAIVGRIFRWPECIVTK